MRGGRNKFGPMYKRDRARKLQVMRQRQLALQALRSSIGSDIKPTPLSPGYQQAYPNMNIKQEIQIPQVSARITACLWTEFNTPIDTYPRYPHSHSRQTHHPVPLPLLWAR